MNAADVALLRRLLGQLEDEAARLDQQAERLKDRHNGYQCVDFMGQCIGIMVAVTAIRCALPQLAKEKA